MPSMTEPSTPGYGTLVNKAPSHVRTALVATLRAERDRCKARHAAIVASPDACVAMTEPPIGLTDAGKWNGYLPPKWHEESGRLVRNRTPMRDAVIAILETIGYHEEGF